MDLLEFASFRTAVALMKLDKSQIKLLRAEAHRIKLKPVARMGQKGFSENLHLEIEQAINHHELIKIKIVAENKDDRIMVSNTICEEHQCQLIQSIGNVIVVYRNNPEINRYEKIIKK